jgi:hypothetical protein
VRRHYLNDGDVVLIGKHELIYVDERHGRGRSAGHETEPKIPVLGDIPELHAPPAEGAGERAKDKRSAKG